MTIRPPEPTDAPRAHAPHVAVNLGGRAVLRAAGVSRMPDAHAVGAAYRESMNRELRLHAALGIPWVVSGDGRSHFVLWPGLPRWDIAQSDAYAARIAAEHVRAPGTMAALSAWAHASLRLSDAEIAGTLRATVATVGRWQRDQTSPRGHQLVQCSALHALITLLEMVFPSSGRAMRWLTTTPVLPGSTSPLDMIRGGAIMPLVWVLSTIDTDPF